MLAFRFVVSQPIKQLIRTSGSGSQTRLYSITRVFQSTESNKPPQPEDLDQAVETSQAAEQVEVLYKMPQQFTIRTMLAITGVNTIVSACV